MTLTKLLFNKYFGKWVKFLSRIISHKIIYLLILVSLVTMNLNVNFLHEKMPVKTRQEIYYRINYMLDLENLKKIHSFSEFFDKVTTMIRESKKQNFLFELNRFNLHFLSESSLEPLKSQFEKIKDSMSIQTPSVKYMYLDSNMEIITKHAKNELILRFINFNPDRIQTLDIGRSISK